ncbi:hypothetical protein CVO74_19880 [Xanthomonas prunicola]|uniref:Uncharacterized protein n=1 Tax=Xanthomonas prunicola TaxID=2053930 RepID=A0A2N3RDX1_9XANT|nr:hypothetical protein XpruCFBP8353_22050 [Xanthomonas prunicola]PKV14928.1 hypothetical protein XpruCFBP8354_22310 [Xanthomonas prunicola]PKV19747.1 hypothetical protein CVO74_19880 [Xanthomonas prunicola]
MPSTSQTQRCRFAPLSRCVDGFDHGAQPIGIQMRTRVQVVEHFLGTQRYIQAFNRLRGDRPIPVHIALP